MFEDLDELARGVAENDISRRQAIKWAGYSVLGATLSSMGFAESAEALTRRQRLKCRNKGGTPLAKGNCHCGFKCGANAAGFVCKNNSRCTCYTTTEGRGFCGQIAQVCSRLKTCSRSSQCPSGKKCVVNTCCGRPVCAAPCSAAASRADSEASGLTTVGPSGS